MRWFENKDKAIRQFYIGKQVIAWDSATHKRGTVLTILDWDTSYSKVLKVQCPQGKIDRIHASRVELTKLTANNNKEATSFLLKGEFS